MLISFYSTFENMEKKFLALMMANSMVSELQKLSHYSMIETVGIYISFTSIVGKSKGA